MPRTLRLLDRWKCVARAIDTPLILISYRLHDHRCRFSASEKLPIAIAAVYLQLRVRARLFLGSNNFVSLTSTLNIQRYISINLKDCDEKPRDFVIGETNEIEEQLRQVNSSFNNRSARRDEITRMKIDGNVTSTMLLFKFIAWLFSIDKKNKNFHFFENLQFCRYRALEFSWFYMTNRKKNWKWESWIAIIWSWTARILQVFEKYLSKKIFLKFKRIIRQTPGVVKNSTLRV